MNSIMKQASLLILLFLTILFFGCIQTQETNNNQATDSTANAKNSGTIMNTTPLTQVMSWEDENGSGKIIKNLLIK